MTQLVETQFMSESKNPRSGSELCHFCHLPVENPHIHHKDHDRSNNDPSNLVPAHPRCHTLHHDIAARKHEEDFHVIGLLAEELSEIEFVRIAFENRIRSLRQYEIKEERLNSLTDRLKQLTAIENATTKDLEKAVYALPKIGDFVKNTPGLGPKTIGRLLGAIGDPNWHTKELRPRKLRELYAYCGMHVVSAPQAPGESLVRPGQDTSPEDGTATQGTGGSQRRFGSGTAPRRKKGQKANWNHEARVRLYVIAEGLMKNKKSAYRHVYDEGRAKYEGCEISKGHKHARAMRLVMKAVLRDLWKCGVLPEPQD